MKYLLDTCICVFLMRDRYIISAHIKEVGIQNCCISEITVAELMYGAIWSGNQANIEMTRQFCEEIEVVPISGCLLEFARQKCILRKNGILIDDFDLLIACSAISNDLAVITDNLRHFERLPVNIVNWVNR